MTSPGDHRDDPDARLRGEIERAMHAIDQEPGDEAALSLASRITETLRTATITAGEKRASMAAAMRDRRHLTFTDLGRIMDVTRARASEIVSGARRRSPASAPVPSVALAVVTSPRGLLLSRRTDGTPPWSLVGGEVEPGESPEEAAAREVMEETGLAVTPAEVIGERDHPRTGRHVVYVGCVLDVGADDNLVIRDEGELAELRWGSLADALELMPSLDSRVKDYVARRLRER